MKVSLPSGHEAELRDQTNAGDRRIANKAVRVVIQEDGTRVLSADMAEDVKYALLTRLIVSWDIGQPVPSMVVDPQGLIDTLPEGDLDALYEAIEPIYNRIMGIKDGSANGEGPKVAISGSTSPTTS